MCLEQLGISFGKTLGKRIFQERWELQAKQIAGMKEQRQTHNGKHERQT
jgi:hypothetical protein